MPHSQSAVDRQDRSADVRRCVAGGEEVDDLGDLIDLPEAAGRYRAEIGLRCSSGKAAVMSVSMNPGATTFAVMPRPPSSRATERARPTRPAFEAA